MKNPNPLFPTIEVLAKEIEDAWAHVGRAEAHFCEIAAKKLDRPLGLDFDSLARRICEGGTLPIQLRLDSGFGQPSITLYRSQYFLIEVLCWHTGTPAIHQHAFSGAFRVATGSSVHSRFSFSEKDYFERISFGELRLEQVELLDNNSIVEIPRGRGLIHSTFHLDNPTMTIVARTHQTDEPEFTYLFPGVAYDPSDRSPSLHKRLQMLDTLSQMGHKSYCDCVHAAINNSDLYDAAAIVSRTGGHGLSESTFRKFTEQLYELYGARVSPLISALLEERRRGVILRLRSKITDQHSRYFLAGLLSVSSRADLLQFMLRRYDGEENARNYIATGVAGLFAEESEGKAVIVTAIRAFLDGTPTKSFSEYASREWGRPLREEESASLEDIYSHLLTHPLLIPLCHASRR